MHIVLGADDAPEVDRLPGAVDGPVGVHVSSKVLLALVVETKVPGADASVPVLAAHGERLCADGVQGAAAVSQLKVGQPVGIGGRRAEGDTFLIAGF